MKVHHILYGSYANGPGKRNVVHTYGCPIKCPGCFNPQTWKEELLTKDSYKEIPIEDLFKLSVEQRPDGLTISGGEPLAQSEELFGFLRLVRLNNPELSIVLFSGYTEIELGEKGHWRKLVNLVDILVSGPYEVALKCTWKPLIGSLNQKVHFLSDVYSESDLLDTSRVEVTIEDDILISGFPTGGILGKLLKG